MRTKVLLADRYYVPLSIVDRDAMKREFEVPIETKKFCRDDCPLSAKRGRYCSTCPSKEAKIKMWERVNSPKGKKLVALPSGDRQKVLAILTTRKIKIVDRRPTPKFRSALKWRGKLRKKGDVDDKGRPYADQRGMVRAWRDHVDSGETGGTIISPPRSGKCVYGDTLVRTYDGLVRIDSLFAKYPVGIERVGRFGHVYTPFGMREIRGLYSKVVDRTVEVLLQSGLKLGGTEVHPVMVLDGVIARWTELGKLRGDECVLLPTCIPVEINGTALSVEDAVIVAAIATRARRDKLASGVVEIPLEDLRFSTSVQSAFYRKYRVGCNSEGRIAAPLDTVSCTDCVSSAYPWLPRSIYRASPESTRALLRSVYDGARTVGDHRVAVLPRPLAEVVHLGLLGFGVWTTVEHHVDGSHIAMPADCDLSQAFSAAAVSAVFNEHSSRSPYGLTDRVLSVKFVNEPRTVYDLAVPSVKSFVTNGIASHNTVIGVKCALLHRERTFITASQIDFLRQFGMRFGENSNAIELYRQGKRPVVIVDKKGWKDAHKYGVHVVKKWGKETSRADVVLSPYQQFIHPERGHERLRQHISGKFATVEVDECIRSNTPVVVDLNGTTISAKNLAAQHHPQVVSRAANGSLRVRPVSRIIRKRTRVLVKIVHANGVVWCTSNHPIWIVNKQTWVPAKDVQIGDDVDVYV